jgi:1,4-alpha-glucan branching enzyme
LWRFDGWGIGNSGGIYFYPDDRSQTPWGDTRPDYGRGEVRQFIRDSVIMWLTEFHLDGIRWDSTLNTYTYAGGDLPEGWSLMQWINNEIDAIQPGDLSIAEDMQNNAWITKDTSAGGAGFDSQWDAQFVHPVRAALQAIYDDQRDMWAVKSAIEHRYNTDAFERVIYTESHDEVANGRNRVPEDIWPGNAGSWYSKKRSTLGAVLVMTSPGIPMLFQGQEILEDGYFADTDPIDWFKEQTYAGIKLLYTDLIHLRRNWFNQTRGLRGHSLNVFHTNNNDKMIAFHRWEQGGAGDDVIVVCNFANRSWMNYRIGLPRPGVWKIRFNSDWQGYDSEFDNFYSPDVLAEPVDWDGMDYSGIIQIGPYTAVVFSQDAGFQGSDSAGD